MAETAILRPKPVDRHHASVEEDETQLILATLFDIKAAVYEIHDAILPTDDEEEEEDDT